MQALLTSKVATDALASELTITPVATFDSLPSDDSSVHFAGVV